MKITNEYAQQFKGFYSKVPKAVFAAVAYSYACHFGEDHEHGVEMFLHEWQLLHENGIVQQKPLSIAERERGSAKGGKGK